MASSSSSRVATLFFLLNIISFSISCSHTAPCAPKTPAIYTPKSPASPKCPKDVLKLAVCANLLNGVVNLVLGAPDDPCCTLLKDIADLEAAVCLCTAIKAGVLGIKTDIPLKLSLLVNACGKKLAPGFRC